MVPSPDAVKAYWFLRRSRSHCRSIRWDPRLRDTTPRRVKRLTVARKCFFIADPVLLEKLVFMGGNGSCVQTPCFSYSSLTDLHIVPHYRFKYVTFISDTVTCLYRRRHSNGCRRSPLFFFPSRRWCISLSQVFLLIFS